VIREWWQHRKTVQAKENYIRGYDYAAGMLLRHEGGHFDIGYDDQDLVDFLWEQSCSCWDFDHARTNRHFDYGMRQALEDWRKIKPRDE
jgi:hypothetical protein